MSLHLQREIDNLKKRVLALGADVEDAVRKAVKSVQKRDADEANDVIARDAGIDQVEVAVEEECLKILALHQPVAIDLRFIVAVLKINNDLERTGDLAVNIAQRTLILARQGECSVPVDLQDMARKARSMLTRSLDALVNMDAETARQVGRMDDEVDEANREVYHIVQSKIREQPENVEALIHFLNISRCLERIGDMATNIAEDVIYMINGQIVRHGLAEAPKGK